MSAAALAAALAAAAGVAGAWEALLAVDVGALERRVVAVLAPLRVRGGAVPTVPEHRRLAIVAAVTLFAAGWLIAGPLAAVALGAGGPWVVARSTRARQRRWRVAVGAGAAPAARAMGDALAGGHSLRGAIDEAARSVEGAAGEQLAIAARGLALGETTEAALERLRARAGDGAWDTIAAAIALQRRSGGDLARLLRELAETLEERERAGAAARGATAQARFTGSVVALMPAGAAALAGLASPRMVLAMVRSPPAIVLIVAGMLLIGAGLVAIRRIASSVGP